MAKDKTNESKDCAIYKLLVHPVFENSVQELFILTIYNCDATVLKIYFK